MDDIKIVPRMSIPKVGMQSVRMPIVGNKMDSAIMSIFKDLKSHMIGWYDVKRQGCTNESLAENPVLEDLSGNNHPLELRNFVFGGLSGMGSYGTDLTKWTVGMSSIEYIERTPHKATVKFLNNVFNNFRITSDLKTPIHFKAKTNVRGQFACYGVNDNLIKINSNEDGIFDVTLDKARWVYFMPFNNTVREYTLEILPSYPNSLVFNGTNPTWVYDRDNGWQSENPDNYEWLSNCKLHINKSVFLILTKIESNKGENLNINNPSYKIRISGLPDGFRIRKYNTLYDKDGFKYAQNSSLYTNGTHIISSYSKELIAGENDVCKFYTYYVLYDENSVIKDEYPVDITIEFLPNYPAPTTMMYGAIPSLTQGAKCMMMDFVPLKANSTNMECFYTQRALTYGNNYAIVINNAFTGIAYNHGNDNGTYINGSLNNRFNQNDLAQRRQIISVNASVLQDLSNGIIVGCGENLSSRFAIMALNSLLLFDKELTEEEMKVVMDRIMKYKNVDGIDMLSAPDKIGFTVGEYDGGG